MTAFIKGNKILPGILVLLLLMQALVSFQAVNRAEVVRVSTEVR